jgi:hypothetical protein
MLTLTLRASVNDVVHDTAVTMPLPFAFCKKKLHKNRHYSLLYYAEG